MKKETDVARRSFLKKTAYTIPTIVALGALSSPVVAGASCIKPQGGYQHGK